MMIDARELVARPKQDCAHFWGDRPCAPHTTPLLRALAPAATGTRLPWVTHHRELLHTEACEAVPVSPAVLARLEAERYEIREPMEADTDCINPSLVRAAP